MPQHVRQRPAVTPDSASATMTVTTQPAIDSSSLIGAPSGTLHLRAEAAPSQIPANTPERRIQWAEDVVNNEGMGKKSSKVCCIYHKPREAGESSSDDSSSDSSSSDDDDAGDDGSARPARSARQGRRQPHRHHHHDHDKQNPNQDQASIEGKGKGRERAPNAYERVPKN